MQRTGVLTPRGRDLNPSNVVVTKRGLKTIDYEVIDWPPDAFLPSAAYRPVRRCVRIARRVWQFIRVARLPGGGESRDIWKLGPAASNAGRRGCRRPKSVCGAAFPANSPSATQCGICRSCIGPWPAGSAASGRHMMRAIGYWRRFRSCATCIRGTSSRRFMARLWLTSRQATTTSAEIRRHFSDGYFRFLSDSPA